LPSIETDRHEPFDGTVKLASRSRAAVNRDTIPLMKHVLTVFGVVHPRGGGWYLDAPFTTTTPEGSKIQIAVTDATYSMRIETEGPHNNIASMNDASLATWMNEVIYGHQPLPRGLLDSLGLHVGAALDPEMTGGTLDGVVTIGSLTKLGAYGTQEGAPRVGGDSFFPTWLLTVSNPFARLALADVRHALRFDEDCPFFCYRAVDALRQHYAATTEGKSEKASWEKLRTELGVELAEIMALKAFADSRRHGGAGTSVHADHLRWTRWTREVVGRFLTKHSPDVPTPETFREREFRAAAADAPLQRPE
jgi:hypothetical protein